MSRRSTTHGHLLASRHLAGAGDLRPGIATGLVSGAPQLGAGAIAGAAIGAAGTAVAVGAAATGVGGAVAAGARMAPAAASWPALCACGHVGGWQCEIGVPGRLRRRRRWCERRNRGPGQRRPDRRAGSRARRCIPRLRCRAAHGRSLPRWLEWRCRRWWRRCGIRSGCRRRGRIRRRYRADAGTARRAKRLHRRQQLTHAATTAAHTLRGGDGGGSGQGPSLRDSDS